MPTFDDFGIKRGLAYKHDFQSSMDNQLRLQQFQDQQRLQREEKARYYSDKIKRGNASTEYNSKRLEPFYNKLNKELGTFIVENPNWEQDIKKVLKYNEITDKYLNNEILREELDVQKQLEMIRADRHNMSEEHFNSLMEEYDQYNNQEIDSFDPLSFSYKSETKLDFTKTISDISRNIGIKKSTNVGDKYITKEAFITNQALEDGYTQMLSNPEYKKSLENAWMQYNSQERSPEESIFSSMKEFGISSLKSTKTIGELSRRLNPEYKANLGDSEGSVAPRGYILLQELIDNKGNYAKGGSNLLNLTDVGSKNTEFNPSDVGALFINQNGAISDYSWAEQLEGARTITSSEITYIPENGSYFVKTQIVVPQSDNWNDEFTADMTAKDGKGFKLRDDLVSDYGIVVGKTEGEKKYLIGTIWLPADPSSTTRMLNYNDSFGRSIEQQSINQAYSEKIKTGYTSLADILDERNTIQENQLNEDILTPFQEQLPRKELSTEDANKLAREL